MISKTAITYGGALYDLAQEELLEKKLLDELLQISALFRQNPDYTRLLMEPSIEKTQRAQLIDEAWKDQVHPYVLNFMKLLCDNGTISLLPDCVKAFRSRYNAAHGIIDVRAVCAVPLTDDQTARLRAKLEAKCHKQVELSVQVDPSLLGGIRLELPDRQLDGSVRNHLSQIQQLLESSTL